jgi:DNA (cytosine-5)-methyltransferase 1
VLFGEQVASAPVFGKSAKRVRGAPEWAWLDDLSDRLEAAHYAVGASDIPAAGVGAPHIRQRTFFGAVRLANADGRHTCTEGKQCGGEQRFEPQDGVPERLDYPASTRPVAKGQRPEAEARNKTRLRGLERGCGPERLAAANGGQRRRVSDGQGGVNDRTATGREQGDGEPERGGAGERPITDHGGWDDVDWLFCRDGKWRPVKSGVQRVADGIPGSMVQGGDFVPASQPIAQSTKAARRVMRLRGYGNAIVPQAAALFIKAFDPSGIN